MGIDPPTTPIESPIVVAGISDGFSRLCEAGVISAVIAVSVAGFCSARDHEPRDPESTRDDQSMIEELFPFYRMRSSVHSTIAVGSESKALGDRNTFRPTGGLDVLLQGRFTDSSTNARQRAAAESVPGMIPEGIRN